jgi:hypothetical protein
MNKNAIQSYVYHCDSDKAFYVSTILRESSAAAAYGSMYLETIVWEWDATTKKRGGIVAQGEGLLSHFDFCRQFYENGACK